MTMQFHFYAHAVRRSPLFLCRSPGADVDDGFYRAPQKHVLQIGQCLPKACTPDDIEVILSEDDATIKFNEIYANATGERRGALAVINVRRVPGDFDVRSDPTFYLIV